MKKPVIAASIAALLCAASLTLAGTAQAASILWGPATNITGDSDVSTAGISIIAYNFGAPSVPATTVNGVTFSPFAVSTNPTTVGNFSVQESPGQLFSSNTLFGSAAAPFTNLSTSYQNLLQSGIYSMTPSAITLTMNNLVIGQTYQFQWWTNTSGAGTSNNFVRAVAGNTVTLSPNTTNTVGGLGQSVIGTFVADSTTQSVSYTGTTSASSSGPVLNAFQLRATSTDAPEPATLTLILFGTTVFASRRIRRQS